MKCVALLILVAGCAVPEPPPVAPVPPIVEPPGATLYLFETPPKLIDKEFFGTDGFIRQSNVFLMKDEALEVILGLAVNNVKPIRWLDTRNCDLVYERRGEFRIGQLDEFSVRILTVKAPAGGFINLEYTIERRVPDFALVPEMQFKAGKAPTHMERIGSGKATIPVGASLLIRSENEDACEHMVILHVSDVKER